MMNLKNKWSLVAGGVLISGAVLTAGIAFAGTSTSGTAATPAPAASSASTQTKEQDRASRIAANVQSGKITQAQADVMTQLDSLRKTAMEKLQADEKALLDQAVKDGKLTQAQADQLAQHGGDRFGGDRGGRGEHGRGDRAGGPGFKAMTQDELKAKLDADVKAGKITQAQEDAKLKQFADWQAKEAQEHNSQSQSTQGQ